MLLQISKQGWKSKSEIAYNKIIWELVDVTPEQFIEKVCTGHSYCNIFKNLDRRDAKFEKAYQVSVDIDDSDISLHTFLKKLSVLPTAAYTTFSNLKNGKYRFRLLYWSKYALCSKRAYADATAALINHLGISEYVDRCSLSCTQLMNGTGSDADRFISKKIYDFEQDFGAKGVYTTDLFEGTGLDNDWSRATIIRPNTSNNSSKNKSTRRTKLLSPDMELDPAERLKERRRKRRGKDLFWRKLHDSSLSQEELDNISYTNTPFLSGRAKNNGTRVKKKRNPNQYRNILSKTASAPNKRDYRYFWGPMINEVKKFKDINVWIKKEADARGYKPITRTPLKFNAAGYAEIPENYIELPVLWNNNVWGERTVQKFVDGMHRRETLFTDLIKIRLIKKSIGIRELFWQALWRVAHYYDNSDGVLSVDLVARKTWDVIYLKTLSRYRVNNKNRTGSYIKPVRPAGSIVVNTKFCKERNINPLSHSRFCVMIAHYTRIEKWYDPNLSVKENYKFAKKHKMDNVSERTLRRFCEYLNLNTNPKKNTPADWYNPGLSINDNMQWAVEHGIKTSSSTLYNYCKANDINPKGDLTLNNGYFGYNQQSQQIKPGINESAVLSKAIIDMLLKLSPTNDEKIDKREIKDNNVTFDIDWSEYFGEITETNPEQQEIIQVKTPDIINNEISEEPEKEKYKMTADEPLAFELDVGDLMSRLHKSKCQNPVPLGWELNQVRFTLNFGMSPPS